MSGNNVKCRSRFHSCYFTTLNDFLHICITRLISDKKYFNMLENLPPCSSSQRRIADSGDSYVFIIIILCSDGDLGYRYHKLTENIVWLNKNKGSLPLFHGRLGVEDNTGVVTTKQYRGELLRAPIYAGLYTHAALYTDNHWHSKTTSTRGGSYVGYSPRHSGNHTSAYVSVTCFTQGVAYSHPWTIKVMPT